MINITAIGEEKLQNITEYPITVHTKILECRMDVEELKNAHSIYKQGCFTDLILGNLVTNWFLTRADVASIIAIYGFRETLDRCLVENGAKSTIRNGERNAAKEMT